MQLISQRSFWGAALGTMVEYYDYALFSLFLPIMAPIFFPAASNYDSLVKSFKILLIVMIARPLGGLLFGYIGDVYGRRKALLASMYGIAFATIAIGLTPSYTQIGFWAIIIIAVAKAVQTFCFGGEYNGAGIYVVEHAKKNNEAFISSLLSATTIFGSFLASLIGIFITLPFMPAWSWRGAFIVGGLIGILGIIYRKNLPETPDFKKADVSSEGLLNLLKLYPRELVAGFFIGGFATVPFTSVLTFIIPILMTKGVFNSHEFMMVQALLILIGLIVMVIVGKIADRKTSTLTMQIGSLFLATLSYPLLFLIDKGTTVYILLGAIGLIVINDIVLGPSNAYLKNLFPMQYRYRGSSLGFTCGMSILGGSTPMVESYLYQLSGKHFTAIALWLAFVGLGTFISITLAVSHRKVLKYPLFKRGRRA